jgi:MFS family permease
VLLVAESAKHFLRVPGPWPGTIKVKAMRSEMFGALKERQFRLLWLGQATSTLGDGLVPVALAFAVIQTLNGSATDLGIVLAAYTLPLVLFVLAGGVWADRLPRQMVMLVSDIVRGVCQATLAVLLLSGAAQLWHLVVLIAIYGTAEAFFQPAATGLVPAVISPGRLQQANALLGLSRSIAFVVGPAIAGVIAATTNPGIVFVADAATFAVSATSLALLRLPRSRREGERHSFLADLKGGWHELVSHTWLWVIVAWASTFLCIVVAPFMTLGPVVAKQSLGGAAAWGIIAAGWGAGSLGGGLLALRWKPARPMLVCTVLVLLIAPAVALLALRASAPVIAAAQAVGGIGMGFFGAVWQTTLQQHVPEEALSRVSAWDWMGSFAFFPLGFILAGPVSGAIGISTTLWISVGYLVASTLVVLLVPSVRNLRRLDEPGEDEVLARLSGEPVEAFHG